MGPAGSGFGFGFDLLEGGFEKIVLLLVGAALDRPGVHKRDQHGQSSEATANQPVEDERQVSQLPFEDRLPANEHPYGSQQNQAAKPAAARCSVESHAGTIAWPGAGRVEETERWRGSS